jgi:hypothetical protein
MTNRQGPDRRQVLKGVRRSGACRRIGPVACQPAALLQPREGTRGHGTAFQFLAT